MKNISEQLIRSLGIFPKEDVPNIEIVKETDIFWV